MLPIRRVLMCLVANVTYFRCPNKTAEGYRKFQESYEALKLCESKGFIRILQVKRERETGENLPIEVETTPVNDHGRIYLDKLHEAH